MASLLPGNVDAEYGISTVLTGSTIESDTETDEPVYENVPDQKNRVAKVLRVDTKYTRRITVRGNSKPDVTKAFTYDGKKYILQSVEAAGTYNGLKRFNIVAFRFANCEQATDVN